jgi:hypothetical protein
MVVTKVRRIRGRPVPATPPWKTMGLVTVVGAAVAVVGLALDSGVVLTIGVAMAILSILGFLVPGFRDVRSPQRVDRESYTGFVLNLFRTTPSSAASHGRSGHAMSPPQSPEQPSESDRAAKPPPA